MRLVNFPSLSGRRDVDSFKDPQNPTDTGFKKWNDAGDYRAMAPYRGCDSHIDPISGFVSAAGDVERNTGHTKIPSLVQLNDTPQSVVPQNINSVRLSTSAPPELQRSSERDPGLPFQWNTSKIQDSSLRAKLGGTYIISIKFYISIHTGTLVHFLNSYLYVVIVAFNPLLDKNYI